MTKRNQKALDRQSKGKDDRTALHELVLRLYHQSVDYHLPLNCSISIASGAAQSTMCLTQPPKGNAQLFAPQGHLLSDHTCPSWQEHETFSFSTAKTSEHKALFPVSLVIFLQRLPTYQISQWRCNHCVSVKSLPTVISTPHHNPSLASGWWRKQ